MSIKKLEGLAVAIQTQTKKYCDGLHWNQPIETKANDLISLCNVLIEEVKDEQKAANKG